MTLLGEPAFHEVKGRLEKKPAGFFDPRITIEKFYRFLSSWF